MFESFIIEVSLVLVCMAAAYLVGRSRQAPDGGADDGLNEQLIEDCKTILRPYCSWWIAVGCERAGESDLALDWLKCAREFYTEPAYSDARLRISLTAPVHVVRSLGGFQGRFGGLLWDDVPTEAVEREFAGALGGVFQELRAGLGSGEDITEDILSLVMPLYEEHMAKLSGQPIRDP